MKWRSCLWIGAAVSALLCVCIAASAVTITVNPGASIQAAINAANPGDVIQLAAGTTYDVASTILVNKAVTVTGAGATVRGTTSGALCVFELSASGAALHGVDVTWATLLETTVASAEVTDSLVRVVGSGLSGVSITGNVIHVPGQAGAMSTWVGRALTVADSACSGAVVISGNTVYNTRNGVVVRSNNSATISDNVIYATKGGIMNYTGSLTDAANRTMSNNSWGTVHNEWDIVWNTFSYFTPDYQQSVIALSSLNNGAYVVDRRAKDAATCLNLTGNRSHLFVTAGSTFTTTDGKPAAGDSNEPFSKISLGVDAVTPGGTIYVSPGTYAGNVIVYKDGVTLKSTGGPGATILNASLVDKSGYKNQWGKGINYSWAETYDAGLLRNGFLVWSDNVTIDGFTIVNAVWPTYNRGIAVLVGSISTTYAGFIPWNIDQWGGLISPVDKPTPTGVTIRNMLILGPSDGIYVWSSSGNTIEGNTILNTTPLGGAGIIVYEGGTDNLIQGNSVQNAAGDAVAICGVWPDGFLDVGGTQVLSNDLLGSANGLKFYNVADPTGKGVVALYNVVWGNVNGILVEGGRATVPHVHYNSIAGNTGFGVLNTDTTGSFDATLNWWGDVDGPSGVGTGSGDAVSTYVIFSPWLGTDPDGNPALAGVQMISPMLIIVDDVGPAPTGGYLNAAIGGTNGLVGQDTIVVMDGSFAASTPILDGVTLLSQNGAEHTSIGGSLLLNSANVILGRMREGFAIHAPITVGAGVDASTIHINWNDIYDVVTNGGGGWLDATFNYWGADGPDTVGLVNVYPYLPVATDTLIGYVDEYGYSVSDAIAFAALLLDGTTISEAELIVLLASEFGLSAEEAAALIDDYGRGAVHRAAFRASGLDEFLLNLVGYEASIPSGGAGGGAGGDLGGYAVGSTVPLFLVLADPFTGDPVVDALVTYTLTRELEGGVTEIVRFGVMSYAEASGGYAFALDTTGLAPGSYVVYLGTDDGHNVSYTILLTE
jgi:parallel beta-helix repeat protein